MNLTLLIPFLAAILLPIHAQCVFNDTHCACTISTAPAGLCTRFSSGTASSATCFVDNCKSNNYVCDCSGLSMCEINACDSWRANNPTEVTAVGDLVSCTFQAGSATCIQSIELGPSPSMSPTPSPDPTAEAAPSPSPTTTPGPSAAVSLSPSPTASPCPTPSASPTGSPASSPPPSSSPSPVPPEYRMVQFGAPTDASMFNMTAFTDVGDFITTTFDMRNRWPEKTRLEHRWHTVMLYQNDAGTEHFLCYIMNTYDAGDDFLGVMEAVATVTGSDGQTMTWAACDDALDSCQTPSGNVISSYFGNVGSVTNGFCVKPVDFSGNTFMVQLTDVRLARGVRFINPTGTVREFMWEDGATNGLTGPVNVNGLVTLGTTPVIHFNLAGLLVP